MLRLPYRLIVLAALAAAPQLVCQTAVSEPPRGSAEIAQFEAADRVRFPAAGTMVFAGSSSIARWETLARDFAGLPVLNRGIGGYTLHENVGTFDRIILPYKPPVIVLYSGENDLTEGRTPTQVFQDFQSFVALTHAKLPATQIVYVSIKPSIARWSLTDSIRAANRLIRDYVSKDKQLQYVDVFTPMLDASGQIRRELFVEDGLHMNAQGYAIWRRLILPALKPQVPLVLGTPSSANWRDRDSTVIYERFLLPANPPAALVVVYGSAGGDRGSLVADTISYVVPPSGILHLQRRLPVPWAETHLYRVTAGAPTEVRVAADCALHRVATRQFPGQLFGCWMPLVVSPNAPTPYMAAALSDSAGLAMSFNHAMELINTEVFFNHLPVVPLWVEPNAGSQNYPLHSPPNRS
jgi:lysophospholipase L1-like esterase